MSTALRRLIDSGWLGSINEVGIGVPLLAAITSEDGASRLLFDGRTTYNHAARMVEPSRSGTRLVSEQLVMEESKLLYEQLSSKCSATTRTKIFAYSVSGSHKPVSDRGETHFWAALTYTCGWDRAGVPISRTDTFHAWVPKHHELSRVEAAKHCLEAHLWFLEGVLLNKHLECPTYPLQSPLFIDVVNSASMPLSSALQLVGGPLIGMFVPGPYGEPIMARPQDHLRTDPPKLNATYYYKNLVVYRGSFDPVHKAHVELAESLRVDSDVIFEICLNNFWGKHVSLESVSHRVRMLTGLGYRVIVSSDPLFNDLTATLKRYGVTKVKYLVGSDVFNAILGNPKLRPEDLSEMGPSSGVSFLVCEARGPITVPARRRALLTYQPFSSSSADLVRYSSTAFRSTKDLTLLPNSVAAYVKENHRYGF